MSIPRSGSNDLNGVAFGSTDGANIEGSVVSVEVVGFRKTVGEFRGGGDMGVHESA